MPLGWERINVKQTTPNKNIVFIKPLPGPTEKTAKDFLERIAAQCLPIMNKHHLAVVSLEEYEYNSEFLGRNFNNGEVIQLVLHSASGNWLPFNFVQMVMMHELAHIKQMNHSKAFWAVRNEFAAEMKVLWGRGYTGDGLWGRGVLLENGLFAHELDQGEIIPEHMCGGTFKSRGGKKRMAKPKITYKEQKERRIRKKFGINGVALGAHEDTKVKLENGKKLAGKPRVAGSKRGRELRAAAALARFEVKKEEPKIKDEDLVTDSEAEGELDDAIIIKSEPDDAIDVNGQRLLDKNGRGMVRVCEDEDKDDEDAKNELLDFHIVPGYSQRHLSSKLSGMASSIVDSTNSKSSKATKQARSEPKAINESTSSLVHSSPSAQSSKSERWPPSNALHSGKVPMNRSITQSKSSSTGQISPSSLVVERSSAIEAHCPICSVVNVLTALTCTVCTHVLKPNFVPNSWRCKSETCRDCEGFGENPVLETRQPAQGNQMRLDAKRIKYDRLMMFQKIGLLVIGTNASMLQVTKTANVPFSEPYFPFYLFFHFHRSVIADIHCLCYFNSFKHISIIETTSFRKSLHSNTHNVHLQPHRARSGWSKYHGRPVSLAYQPKSPRNPPYTCFDYCKPRRCHRYHLHGHFYQHCLPRSKCRRTCYLWRHCRRHNEVWRSPYINNRIVGNCAV